MHCVLRRFMICLLTIGNQLIKLRTIRWSGMWHAWKGREINEKFCRKCPRKDTNWEN